MKKNSLNFLVLLFFSLLLSYPRAFSSSQNLEIEKPTSYRLNLYDIYMQSNEYLKYANYTTSSPYKAYPGTGKVLALEFTAQENLAWILAFIWPLNEENVVNDKSEVQESFNFTKAIYIGPIYDVFSSDFAGSSSFVTGLSGGVMAPANADILKKFIPSFFMRNSFRREKISILLDIGCTGCIARGISFSAIGFGYSL
jgi:hypothetical protein